MKEEYLDRFPTIIKPDTRYYVHEKIQMKSLSQRIDEVDSEVKHKRKALEEAEAMLKLLRRMRERQEEHRIEMLR